MSEDKADMHEDLKGGSRRSRKDQQGRDYVCGCGKRYLSYPALYTHIKTKHNGQQPEGTQKTGISPLHRRAKQQKVDNKIMKEMMLMVPLESLRILTQLDENAHGEVKVSSRIKREQVGKEIFEAFHALIKGSCLAIDKKSSLESVLAVYIFGAGQYTSEYMYLYYFSFAKLFRSCFHDYAQEIYENCFRATDSRKDKVLNIEQCKMAPIICDFFLRFYVPHENKDLDFISVMGLISWDFCNWMYANKLTIVEISMNKSYQISRRNLIEPKLVDPVYDKEDKEDSEEHNSSVNQSEAEDRADNRQEINQRNPQAEEPDKNELAEVNPNGDEKIASEMVPEAEVEPQVEIEPQAEPDANQPQEEQGEPQPPQI